MTDDQTILQIIPAPNWWGKYKEGDGTFFYHRASCWALIEEVNLGPFGNEKSRFITLMDSDKDGCVSRMDESNNFDGWYYCERDLTDERRDIHG